MQLPEDDVPVELLAATRWEKDDDVAAKESESYIPREEGDGK